MSGMPSGLCFSCEHPHNHPHSPLTKNMGRSLRLSLGLRGCVTSWKQKRSVDPIEVVLEGCIIKHQHEMDQSPDILSGDIYRIEEEVFLFPWTFESGIVAGCKVRCHARPAFRQVPSHHLLVMSECRVCENRKSSNRIGCWDTYRKNGFKNPQVLSARSARQVDWWAKRYLAARFA